jgi:hypothetical protein
MYPARRIVARMDFSIELRVPRRLARATWVADWLRNLAAVIERGDVPRAQGTGTPLGERADPQAGYPAG